MYSYAPENCHGDAIDPINVVFVDAPTWHEASFHFGSWHHGPGWDWESTDAGQAALNVNGLCTTMAGEQATGDDSSWDRWHVRLLEYGFTNGEPDPESDGWHVHGTAHRDEMGWNWENDGVFGEPVYRPCGHAVPPDGFNNARDQVVLGFIDGGHRLLKLADWDNTRSMQQCNDEWASSDGWVGFLEIGHS